jgi:hypothetical protein
MTDSLPSSESHRESTPNAAAGERGRYVYCIVESEEPLDLGPLGIGTDDSPVYTVHHDNLAAVVSDTPLCPFTPTRENLLAHEIVNERIIRDRTAIPMSFGTILREEADVVALLRGAAPTLSEAFAALRGKIELGLTVVWDREKVVAELEAHDEAVQGLKDEIANERNGSTYFSRVQLGKLVEGALEERANQLMWSVYEPLRPLSVASRMGKLVGDNMILNMAFLVERAQEEEFDQAVKRLTTRYETILSFKYTGPWPPYSFVKIRLKLERAAS